MRFHDLTTFTFEELKALLDGRSEDTIGSETAPSIDVTSASQGPGYLNKWRLLEGNKNVWEKLQPTEIIKKRPKVILSHSAAGTRSMAYAILLTALKEHCDVITWPKNARLMAELSPLHATEYNLEHIADMKAASESSVQKALAEQGLNINDYKIIDEFELQKLIFKLSKRGAEKDYEDVRILDGYNLDFNILNKELTALEIDDLLAHGIDYEKLKFVMVSSPSDIQRIAREHLANITVIIDEPSKEELDFYLALPIDGIIINELNSPEDEGPWNAPISKIRSIQINGGDINRIYLINLTNVESIKITNLDKLTHLATTNKKHLNELTCLKCPELRSIVTNNHTIDKYTALNCHANLQFIGSIQANLIPTITQEFKCDSEQSDIYKLNFATLRVLELINPVRINTALAHLAQKPTSIEKFSIINPSIQIDIQAVINEMPLLTSLEIVNCFVKKLDLSKHRLLRTLFLKQLLYIKEIIHPHDIILDELIYDVVNIDCKFKNLLTARVIDLRRSADTKPIYNLMDLLYHLNLNGDQIESLAFSYFDSDHLDFREMTKIRKITITNSFLEELYLPSTLEVLSITSNDKEFDFGVIKEIGLAECAQLTHLSIPNNTVNTIIFSANAKLKNLDLFSVDETKLENFNRDALERLHIDHIKPSMVEDFATPSLRYLDIGYIAEATTLYERDKEYYNLVDYFPNLAAVKLGIDTRKTSVGESDKLKHTTFHFDNLSGPRSTATKDKEPNNNLSDSELSDVSDFIMQIPARLQSYPYSELVTLTFDSTLEYERLYTTSPVLTYDPPYKDIKVINFEGFDNPTNFDPENFSNLISYNWINCVTDFSYGRTEDNSEENSEENEDIIFDSNPREISRYPNMSEGELGIDNETNAAYRAIQAEGELYTQLISHNPVSIYLQRLYYFDRFYYDANGQLQIGQLNFNDIFNNDVSESLDHKIHKFDKNIIEAIEKNIKRTQSKETLGYFHGSIKPFTWYILPLNSVAERDDHLNFYIHSDNIIDPQQAIKIAWSDELKQAAFMYTTNDNDSFIDIDVYYHIKQSPDYRNTSLLDEDIDIIVTDDVYLPENLYNQIYNLIVSNPTLSKLLDQNMPTSELVKLIFNYCSSFTNTTLNENTQDDHTKILLDIISEMKGSCRHRASACLVLLQFFGIKSRIVKNAGHRFVEVAYLKDNKINLLGLDMGGAPRNDLTNEAEFDFKKPTDIPDTEIPLEVFDPETSAAEEEYVNLFKKYAVETKISNVSTLFEKSKFAPLVRVADESEALKVDKLLLDDIRSHRPDTTYLYIHNPKELKQFFDSAAFDKVGLKLNRLTGELAADINKKSTIAINLTTFSAAEIAAFKSSVDTERKLFGMPISKDVTIILLISDNTPACAALYSRCQKYVLSADLLANKNTIEANFADSMQVEELELDFFNHPLWEEMLFGEIKFQGDQINVIPSSLIKALREGLPITLFNLPENKELAYLIHRLQTHGHLFYNGEFLSAAPGFSLKIDTRAHMTKAANLTIYSKPIPNKDKIIIGLHNIHLLYSQLHVTPPYGYDKEGLLASYNPNKQVFYVVDSIPENQLAYLNHMINTRYPEKSFNFCLAPNIQMGDAIGKTSTSNQRADAIYVSNDPEFLAKKLLENTTPIPVNKFTTFSDLIYDISITAGEKIKFSSNTHDIAKTLQNKHNIVLVGEISQQLSNELSTLLEKKPYYIDRENNRVNLNGKLTLVLPNNHDLSLNKIKNCEFNIDDYPLNNDDIIHLNKIKEFYRLANKALSTTLPISYQLLRTMIDRLKNPILHPHNPIKGLMLYNYPKNSDEYALLNIIAKYTFTPDMQVPINQARLSTLINQLKEKSIGELNLNQSYYRILNCFAGKALKYLIGDNIEDIFDRTSRPDEINNRFLDACEKFYQSAPAPIRHKNPIDQLLALLDQDIPLIILKGPPGVGKSYTVRQIQNLKSDIVLFDGTSAIEAWLSPAANGETKALLLDEANMALPGTWDFLKGLSLDKKTLLYKGKFYQLSDNHKIIAAVNPEDYPGRHQHAYFQHYGETLYFKPGDKQFLEQNIIGNLLQANGLNASESEFFYQIYELYIQHQPYRAISIRDLEAFTSRVCALVKTGHHANQALYEASINEFGFSINNKEQRENFISRVEALFQSKHVDFTPYSNNIKLSRYAENFYLPTPRYQLAELIEENITLCDFAASQSNNALKMKLGILLEGDSGIGKSTLYLKILAHLGYLENHANPIKRFYHCSALDTNVIDILTKAFHEGSKVILDELDLNPELEHCLNQFLSGVDMQGNPAKTPGFMLLASQNGVQFVGRSSTPYALANRFHYINIDKLIDEELTVIAERVISNPKAFVSAFHKVKKDNPNSINMRSFYSAIDELEHGPKRKFDNDSDESHDADDNRLWKRQRTDDQTPGTVNPKKPSY